MSDLTEKGLALEILDKGVFSHEKLSSLLRKSMKKSFAKTFSGLMLGISFWQVICNSDGFSKIKNDSGQREPSELPSAVVEISMLELVIVCLMVVNRWAIIVFIEKIRQISIGPLLRPCHKPSSNTLCNSVST